MCCVFINSHLTRVEKRDSHQQYAKPHDVRDAAEFALAKNTQDGAAAESKP